MTTYSPTTEQRGTFTISIDFEYALGYADAVLSEERERLIKEEAAVSRRILKLFETYDVSATWAIVGHFLECDCQLSGGRVHPTFRAPVLSGPKLAPFA
ncbi:hypothetical protein KC906_04405, partial [Candidatus Kaiserbacteria bacterium]|nr:hypothetical protein [Candidatus Kaiserbacteria bacterium]